MNSVNTVIPYPVGTKKYDIAVRLISGKNDVNKIANELGVSISTVYTVRSNLRRMGLLSGRIPQVVGLWEGLVQQRECRQPTTSSSAFFSSSPIPWQACKLLQLTSLFNKHLSFNKLLPGLRSRP